MASTNKLSSPPPGGPSRSTNGLSGWLSQPLRRTNKLRTTTNPVEEAQQQPLSSSEESPSANANIISPDHTTTITPNSNSSRPARPSILKRLFRRRRRARGARNSGLEFDQIEPERGFSPPRHRQPEWMRRWRDDDEGRVSESSKS